MELAWELEQSASPIGLAAGRVADYELHQTQSSAISSDDVYRDLAETLQLAIAKLNDNINDVSLFFLISWEPITATITISVTDDQRANDSKTIVRCHFTELVAQDGEGKVSLGDVSADLSFWCKEFLSTDQEFTQFSLVALYTDSSRHKASIL
ncbi:hypothetical protein MO867_21500 [Microbulbifer sp. OS29]|uniref:Uncharacterized protein n=1 Tax=Microbulbifer okhotskensis TaxID=2926617 RepID=A0A9X2ER79_9GAMM|nr:hypothetical protein [Microbulbifer okhotskensis]MCO1336907.1 hypothetical protein [Microbulbifer okhotskensis]